MNARSLYRSFLKVQRAWPRQEHRSVQPHVFLLSQIRSRFRSPLKTDLSEALSKGQQELAALESLLNNQIEEKVLSSTHV